MPAVPDHQREAAERAEEPGQQEGDEHEVERPGSDDQTEQETELHVAEAHAAGAGEMEREEDAGHRRGTEQPVDRRSELAGQRAARQQQDEDGRRTAQRERVGQAPFPQVDEATVSMAS